MSGIAMGQRYSHLSLEERCRLRGMMEMSLGVSEIARRMGRHRSTIRRELDTRNNPALRSAGVIHWHHRDLEAV